ncbi:Carboxylesterase A [Tolypocladium paradoxum]|uniref:Carboxylesterase A n=1 Tax=Tolypocladium paradoxum TaxID=94208 RepID=A0A2S4KW24_9HYPO|nr:Carboxylesterase A [Tolypocladium paradoxum]
MRHSNALLLAASLPGLALSRDNGTLPAFDWNSITPSRDLQYHACYDGLQCARLVLPLDWQNDTDARTIALAVIKLPAVVPASDPSFAGPILSNPGGPGSSGVAFIQDFARRLRSIVDKPGRRHYEIVSFDPRGIAYSWPRADCFPGDALAREALMLAARGHGALDSSRLSVPYALGLFKGFGRRCLRAEAQGLNGGDIMAYMSTPSVARDMVEIIDKIEELRKREAHDDGDEHRPEFKERRSDDDDVVRLQYIGFSYGTILGNYFASMFPERIGRIVLDGVGNANDYSAGPGWLTNTVDADEIASDFFSGCHAAGPSVCALARSGDSSGIDIQARFDAWLNAIDESPLTAVTPAGDIVVATSRDVRQIMGNVLYVPMQMFRILAFVLNAAMAANTTALVGNMARAGFIPHLKDACTVGGNTTDAQLRIPRIEGGFSVLCADGDSVLGKDTTWWRRYVEEQVQTSSLMGASWSNIRLSCSAWPFTTNWSFKGPFTTPKAEVTAQGTPIKGKPAAPLLFLSTRLDPVTPLSAARAMAALHPGAGLVVQEGLGHCALASGDSCCTARILADYFESGIVPADEATCDVDCGPWDKDCALAGVPRAVDALELLQKPTFPLHAFNSTTNTMASYCSFPMYGTYAAG